MSASAGRQIGAARPESGSMGCLSDRQSFLTIALRNHNLANCVSVREERGFADHP